jgi:hypothetical protein
MALPANIQPLLQKEMSRKEFLIALGLGIASILGFSHIIHLFTGKSVENHLSKSSSDVSSTSGYGN